MIELSPNWVQPLLLFLFQVRPPVRPAHAAELAHSLPKHSVHPPLTIGGGWRILRSPAKGGDWRNFDFQGGVTHSRGGWFFQGGMAIFLLSHILVYCWPENLENHNYNHTSSWQLSVATCGIKRYKTLIYQCNNDLWAIP